MLHECGKLYFFATIILQSMSVKRTMVAVSILVWIQSILLSVAVMLDIPCTVMATAVKVCTFSIDPPCLFLLQILPLLSYLSLDVDECAENHNCEGTCVNTEGSFHCACSDGLVVADDGRSCVPSCGGRLTQATGSLSTPGWPHYYPSIDFRCLWVIDIEDQTDALINITFSQPYGIRGNSQCRTDYVQVLDGVGERASSLGRFCFLNVPQPITTSSHQATVIFQASSRAHRRNRVGVGITYSTILNN